MNVLVIPEDFRKDQYMLKPIVEAMLRSTGKPGAKVIVCKDPLLGNVSQALRWERIEEIIRRYQGMIDLFLLCVDRDGEQGRRASLDRLETLAAAALPEGRRLLAVNAWQEIEVWVLAGHDLPKGWTWQKIRAEIHPKENYYLPLAEVRGVLNEPAEGRKTLAEEASRRYSRIRRLCKEDIAALEARL